MQYEIRESFRWIGPNVTPSVVVDLKDDYEDWKRRDKKMKISKLQLFLTFIKADKRCSPQFMGEPKRKGIPVGDLDFPLLRYIFSLENRLRMLTILRNEIHNSNKEAKEEIKRTHENGLGTNENGLILTVYYESFLNQIYNIMENLAKINLFMFDMDNNPSPRFSKQMTAINKGNLNFHPDYDELIKEEMDWYMEVHQIRSNTNHFMVGMNVFGRADDGEWIPEYMNFHMSERLPGYDFIIKRNILRDTDFFIILLFKSLIKYLRYILRKWKRIKHAQLHLLKKMELNFEK